MGENIEKIEQFHSQMATPGTMQESPKCKRVAPTPRVQEICRLKLQNPALTHREIGKIVDCDHAAVTRALKRWGVNGKRLAEFKLNKADIFAGRVMQIIEKIKDDKVDKASLKDAAYAIDVLTKCERLERGESTENVNFAAVVAMIAKEEAQKRQEKTAPEEAANN